MAPTGIEPVADAEDRSFPAAKTKVKASGVKAGGVLFISACAVGCLEKVVLAGAVVSPGLCGVWCRSDSPENGMLACSVHCLVPEGSGRSDSGTEPQHGSKFRFICPRACGGLGGCN